MTCARYIIIGDVHGCLTELQGLICRIAPGSDDTLVFLGDLVDKGPESSGVVRWACHLATICSTTSGRQLYIRLLDSRESGNDLVTVMPA
jgi:Calcineurin-like phosphoesterase